MKEYEIYNRNEGLTTLHVNVFENPELIKVTQCGPLGYANGTMDYVRELLEQENIESRNYALQVDISGGITTNQISILEDGVADFERVFSSDDFKSVNIYDTFGDKWWGNAERNMYTRR